MMRRAGRGPLIRRKPLTQVSGRARPAGYPAVIPLDKDLPMNGLIPAQLDGLSTRLAERRRVLLEDIRRVLARSGGEGRADLVAEVGDAGDEAAASLLREVGAAEIARDVGELRDVAGAQGRLAAGHFGGCIECGKAIGFRRLEVYPTAKRCITCQERHEAARPGGR